MKTLFVLILLAVFAQPAFAQDQINFPSSPDELAIFLNDIAYARDEITLPGGVDVRLVLPAQVYQDTLIVREYGVRVPVYRLSRTPDGQIALQWGSSAAEGAVRTVTVEYLLSGVGWTPKYDMWLGDNDAETVALDFYAEVRNPSLSLDDVAVRLVAGRVDTSQQMSDIAAMTANQRLVDYEAYQTGQSLTGTATIQHVYELGFLTAQPGEMVYARLQESDALPARRVYLWNAQTDRQVTVIYKVLNDSELPFAEGIVRTYQDNLFLGSDFVELTPVGSEGSITVGSLQNVRVERTEAQSAIDFASDSDRDTLHEVTLTVSNFGDEPVEIEVVDVYSPYALEFEFSAEPAREGDNILRWIVTVESGGTAEIRYSFKD